MNDEENINIILPPNFPRKKKFVIPFIKRIRKNKDEISVFISICTLIISIIVMLFTYFQNKNNLEQSKEALRQANKQLKNQEDQIQISRDDRKQDSSSQEKTFKYQDSITRRRDSINLFYLDFQAISFQKQISQQIENSKSESNRWQRLNSPSITINKCEVVIWKTLSGSNFENMNWGFPPLLYYNSVENKTLIPFRYVLHDSLTNEVIKEALPVFTKDEVDQELKRIKYSGSVKVFYVFTLRFAFENKGKTDANDVFTKIYLKENNNLTNPFELKLKRLEGSGIYFLNCDYPQLETGTPQNLSFKVYCEYKDQDGQKYLNQFDITWDAQTNQWLY